MDVIFEGDSLQVVSEINSNPPYLSNTGHFIESINKEKLGLWSSRFIHTPQETNSAAHFLAKEALCNNFNVLWWKDIPISISSIVFREAIAP
jgi:hypothetical protein